METKHGTCPICDETHIIVQLDDDCDHDAWGCANHPWSNWREVLDEYADELAKITSVDVWVGEASGSVIAREWVEDPTVDDLSVDVIVAVACGRDCSVDTYFKNPVILDAIKVGDVWFQRVEWFWSADLGV